MKHATTAEFNTGLMEWRNSAREDGFSPVMMLFGRRHRTSLPIISDLLEANVADEATAAANARRNRSCTQQSGKGRALPDLEPDTEVVIQDSKTGRWDTNAKIIRPSRLSEDNTRTYLVETEEGRQYVRNRRFLRKRARPQLSNDEEERQNQQVAE